MSSSSPPLDTENAETENTSNAPVEESSMETSVAFEHFPDEQRLDIVDAVDRRRYTLETGAGVSPTRTGAEEFLFPVDAACRIATGTLSLPTVVPICVRKADGTPVLKTEHLAEQELPADTYSIELCAPVRVYLRVEGSVRITAGTDRARLEFGTETPVEIGARSRREQPATTVTITDDPEDLMAAVSTFGSALATTSPERSLPSFRGHPPLIERGEELDVPEAVTPPETGLRIEVPPEHRAIYAVAPLAYYLGASVVPGEVPRLVSDGGLEHRLDAPRATRNDGETGETGETDPHEAFETAVARVLKQVFLLDCVTRTEGIYPIDLHERRELADTLEFDLAELYDRPLAERVAAYLEVPFETVEPHLPEWKLTTHIAPTPESAETLPFAVNDLAVVRTPRSRERSVSEERAATISRQTEAVDDFFRSASRGETAEPPLEQYVDPAAADSLEAVWIGEGRPLSGGKASAEAYQNRLDREPTEGDIEVTVVCNDIDHAGDDRGSMRDEHAAVDDAYGSELSLPFEVSVHHDLTTDELSEVLAADADFLHYIGHIDERGFECPDGVLDVDSLDAVGADAFFLNACRSYDQGMAMLDAGAISGIVTLADVANEGALALGKAIPKLLNAGFSMGAALEVARGEALAGQRYLVVGDHGLAVAQAEGVTPFVCEIERENDSFEAEFKSYPTTQAGMGSVVVPYFEGNEEYFLNSGTAEIFNVSEDSLQDFLNLDNIPLHVDGSLRWSKDIDIKDL